MADAQLVSLLSKCKAVYGCLAQPLAANTAVPCGTMAGMRVNDRAEAAHNWLRARHAAEIDHPGGTLLAHLERVYQILGQWGATEAVRLAGLCHAAYGTDGFDVALLDISERAALRRIIGDAAEEHVYFYGSATRAVVYPVLAHSAGETVDRFTGTRKTATPAQLDVFAELTAANELDVIRHSAAVAQAHGTALRRLMDRAEAHLSTTAIEAWRGLPQT